MPEKSLEPNDLTTQNSSPPRPWAREVWTSDQNQEEVHHFVKGAQNTYLFGFNRRLLGEVAYRKVASIVDRRLKKIL